MAFLPHDELGKERCSYYKLENEKGHQAVGDLNAEYDLLNYPLFFPEGTQIRMGWTPYTPKMLDLNTNIRDYYNYVCAKHDLEVDSTLNRVQMCGLILSIN